MCWGVKKHIDKCMNVGINVKICNTKKKKKTNKSSLMMMVMMMLLGEDECALNNNDNNNCFYVFVCEMHRLRVLQKIDR